MPRPLNSAVALVAWVSLTVTGAANVSAVTLSPGDIVVVGEAFGLPNDAIFRIDPTTGDRAIISGSGIGSGPQFSQPFGAVLDHDGTLLVTNIIGGGNPSQILRIDPLTGDRTIASGGFPAIGDGPPFVSPYGVNLDANGNILVAMDEGLMRIDPSTGDRTLLSGVGVGSGPNFGGLLVGLAVEPTGTILAAGFESQAVFRIDPNSGDRSIVSDAMHGSGPLLGFVTGLQIDGESLLLANFQGANGPAVFRVDRVTGDRTIVSSNSIGSGSAFGNFGLMGIALENSGEILVTDIEKGVVRVDPGTGNQTLLSGSGVGVGPILAQPSGILVVPNVPEPTSIVLLAVGLFALMTHVALRRE